MKRRSLFAAAASLLALPLVGKAEAEPSIAATNDQFRDVFRSTLDDYEECTWTPTVVWSGKPFSYVRVGKLVHVSGTIRLD